MHRRYAAHVALLVCSTAAFQRAPLQASPVTRRPLSARTAEKPKPRQRPHGAGRARQGRKRGDLLRDIIDAPRAVEDVPKAKEDPLISFVECLAKAADGRTFAVDLQLPLQPPSRKQKEARGRVTNVRARALLRQGMVEADEETRPKKVIAP